jgi:hypothetical protein
LVQSFFGGLVTKPSWASLVIQSIALVGTQNTKPSLGSPVKLPAVARTWSMSSTLHAR